MKNVVVDWKETKVNLAKESERVGELIREAVNSIYEECGQNVSGTEIAQNLIKIMGSKVSCCGGTLRYCFGGNYMEMSPSRNFDGTLDLAKKILECLQEIRATKVRQMAESLL